MISQTELFTSYTDADFVGDRSTRRSTNRIVIKVKTGAVSWSSKLQGIVILSTTEAEYVATVIVGQKVIWLRYLLIELGYKFTGPFTLFLDNNLVVHVAKNLEHHISVKCSEQKQTVNHTCWDTVLNLQKANWH